MKKLLKKTIWICLICLHFFQIEIVRAIVPYYYFPTIKNLQKQSLYIGKNAYQLLYFGQYKQSLNLAKLAIELNKKIVNKQQLGKIKIKKFDKIEIVHFIGGG